MPLQSVNYKARCFNIADNSGGFTCLGFDECMDRSLGLAAEFERQKSCVNFFKDRGPYNIEYGTPRGYAEYERLCAIAKEANDRFKWRSRVCLNHQLEGLEGHRVEAVTFHGEVKRFVVGKSTGWLPCHLERRDFRSHCGDPVSRVPFKRVSKLYRSARTGRYVTI